jgi:diphthamide biosynthesis methyltransferase
MGRVLCPAQALEQLLEVEQLRGEGAYGPDTLCVGVARLQVRKTLSWFTWVLTLLADTRLHLHKTQKATIPKRVADYAK